MGFNHHLLSVHILGLVSWLEPGNYRWNTHGLSSSEAHSLTVETETDRERECVQLGLAERLWEQPGEGFKPSFGIREGFLEEEMALSYHTACHIFSQRILLSPHNMPGQRLGAGDPAANKSDKVLCPHGISSRILRKHRGISRKKDEIWGGRESGIKVERAERTEEMFCIVCAGN